MPTSAPRCSPSDALPQIRPRPTVDQAASARTVWWVFTNFRALKTVVILAALTALAAPADARSAAGTAPSSRGVPAQNTVDAFTVERAAVVTGIRNNGLRLAFLDLGLASGEELSRAMSRALRSTSMYASFDVFRSDAPTLVNSQPLKVKDSGIRKGDLVYVTGTGYWDDRGPHSDRYEFFLATVRTDGTTCTIGRGLKAPVPFNPDPLLSPVLCRKSDGSLFLSVNREVYGLVRDIKARVGSQDWGVVGEGSVVRLSPAPSVREKVKIDVLFDVVNDGKPPVLKSTTVTAP